VVFRAAVVQQQQQQLTARLTCSLPHHLLLSSPVRGANGRGASSDGLARLLGEGRGTMQRRNRSQRQLQQQRRRPEIGCHLQFGAV